MTLSIYQHKFTHLRVNMSGGKASPHKICMLLALLDLVRSGSLRFNKVEYGPALLERYRHFFNAVRGPSDHPNPYFPFFHLAGKLQDRSESFWHLIPIPGRESELASMTTVTSASDITRNISHAELDPELFMLLHDEESIEALSQTMAQHWFGRGLQELTQVVALCTSISRYEHRIRAGLIKKDLAPQPESIRDPAFRRVITQIYDYRCAATGLRFLLPSGVAMVEAAHIHPFSESRDDDPCNGLALTPNMHWAMDRFLISPGPDLKWHVSDLLDDRIKDNEILLSLRGKPLFLPNDLRMVPKRDALEWRLNRLKAIQRDY
jgi:putative restriction endonuclease